jgi:hypothetical protein
MANIVITGIFEKFRAEPAYSAEKYLPFIKSFIALTTSSTSLTLSTGTTKF